MTTTIGPIIAEPTALDTGAALAALLSDGAGSPEARWTIDSADKAEWYLRKRRNIENEIATVKAQAAELVWDLEADLNRLNGRHEADFLAWVKEEWERRGDTRKRLKLFQGTVSWRTVPGSLHVSGQTDAIEYARAQGWGIVKTVESIDAEAYKREAAATMAESGEVLPGIEIVPERESVSIKFGRDAGQGGKGKGGESEG